MVQCRDRMLQMFATMVRREVVELGFKLGDVAIRVRVSARVRLTCW